MTKMRRLGMVALLGSSFWLTCGMASAATTIVPNTIGEPSLVTPGGLLDSLYGLSNLTRMDDVLDQKWENDGLAHVLVIARFSDYSQTIGYLPGETSDLFVPLVTVTVAGLIEATEVTFTIGDSGLDFRWADDPNGAGLAPGLWSAREDANSDLKDHMATWLITGKEGHSGNRLGAYVIAFEDFYGLGDRDYNDLVALVWGVTDGPLDVPLPASLWLVAVAIVGGGVWRRARA